MNKTEEIIFNILRASLFDKKIALPENIDWTLVYREMQSQGILGFPCIWFNDHPINNRMIAEKWSRNVMDQIVYFYYLLQEQDRLINLLELHGIEFVILKGCTVARYYPHPELRTMGDIDFLVKHDRYYEVYHILLENGYILMKDEDWTEYHYTMQKNGVVVELHNSPAGVPSGKEGVRLKALIEEGLNHVEIIEIEGYLIPVLPKVQSGLVLLLHIIHHLEEGIGWRHVIDWMMFANSNLDDNVWQTEFQDIFANYGLDKLAIAVTRTCQIYLGLRDDISWCKSADVSLCEELKNYFTEQGNLGLKATLEDRGAKVLLIGKNPIKFLCMLQEFGCRNWELVKKYPILKAFAWIYQMCKYIRIGFTRKKPIKNLQADLAESKRRKELFEKLAIFKKSYK